LANFSKIILIKVYKPSNPEYIMDLLSLQQQLNALPTWAFMIILVWSLTWKGFALWKAAKLSKPVWFVAMLVLNTFGILEILFIFVFSKLSFDHLSAKKKK
jgi:hypothetical protein